MRYRMESCGNGGATATYRVVDATLSGFNTTVCECSHDNAKKIVSALNVVEEIRERKGCEL